MLSETFSATQCGTGTTAANVNCRESVRKNVGSGWNDRLSIYQFHANYTPPNTGIQCVMDAELAGYTIVAATSAGSTQPLQLCAERKGRSVIMIITLTYLLSLTADGSHSKQVMVAYQFRLKQTADKNIFETLSLINTTAINRMDSHVYDNE